MTDRSDLTLRYDILIIGGGAAGLYTALSLPSHLQVGLMTKDSLSVSASDWAQGGIAAAFMSDDSPQLHAQDTLMAGAGLCEPEAVNFLVKQAPAQVEALLDMGIAFDRRQDDQLAATLEAAHSRPRVLHAADTTGRALIKTLTAQVWARDNIQVLSETFTLSLWLHPQTRVCQGCCVLSQGQIYWVRADAVVLATGGGGQVFSQTTNPVLSTGDGVAIASRAGAQVRDLEFFQFHPTALMVPGAPHFLISEAVRGEGASLIDANNQRFMFDYDPRGELAPRDIVSRSVFTHLQRRPGEVSVWLDLQEMTAEKIQRRFPKIIEVCQRWGINIFQQRIPVAPAAHYWMGGITTNLETSASQDLPVQTQGEPLQFSDEDVQFQVITDIRAQLPKLVWDSAGICRTEDVMVDAIATIQAWQYQFQNLPLSQSIHKLQVGQTLSVNVDLRLWAETENLLDIAYLILKSALFRTESRGGHYRIDYPETTPQWKAHTLVQGGNWTSSAPVKDPS